MDGTRQVKRLLIGFAAILLIGGALVGHGPLEDWLLLRRFERQDPVREARAAMAARDNRLLAGDYGSGIETPGLEDEDRAYHHLLATHGTRLVITMSDDVMSDMEKRLWTRSHEYMLRYNAEILKSEPPSGGH